jgi:hypothetical protein
MKYHSILRGKRQKVRRALERDLLPTGIFHAIKILAFSAAAILAPEWLFLKECLWPHFGESYYTAEAQTCSPASRKASLKSRDF